MHDAPRKERANPGGTIRSHAHPAQQAAHGAPQEFFERETVPAAKQHMLDGGDRGPSGLIIPIDIERDTRWALVELVYGLQRDARRRWRCTWFRRCWRTLLWIVMTYGVGVAADDRLHVLRWLLQQFR